MGFYGNITNVNSTQFTFDKIYSNRYEMERMTPTDGIYLGRYILVEYDKNLTQNDILYRQCYSKNVEGNEQFYSSPDCSEITRLKFTEDVENIEGIVKGQIIYINKNNKNIYYICIGNKGDYATFKLVVQGEVPYTTNYNIDINSYGESRGYDSTVWQKVYIGTVEKYVMIAELNSVVPTFDLSADAPTMTPITPHFDADSTNVYYKLHWQPQWGLRVAEADTENSDSTAIHRTTTYNPATGNITTEEQIVNAAINFNMPAFDPQTNKGGVNIKKHDNGINYFTINPTGMSGNEYNAHDGTGNKTQQVDIQEMRINLPAIGNMMSDAWDIIHGPKRDNSPVNSLQGRLNFFTNEIETDEIPVQHQNGYLVGAHMEDDEWIATEINATNKTITINHTFNEGSHEIVNYDINGKEDTVDLYVPEIDEMGHVVGETVTTVTLPYGYKTIIPGEKSEELVEIESNTESIVADNTQDSLTITPGNKWIRIAGDKDNDTLTVAHEVHDITDTNISDSDLDGVGEFIVQDLVFDKAGHVTANQRHKYILPNAIRNIDVAGSDAISAGTTVAGKMEADSYNSTLTLNAQNRWVNLKVEGDTISIGHAGAGNEAITAGDTENSTPAFGATFNVPYLKYDEMGHIKSSAVRTITIPKGSLTDTAVTTEGAKVLTDIGFTQADGSITTEHKNVGALKLTDYSAVKTDATYVQSTDSINTAFNKIDTRIDNINTSLANKINELDYTDTTSTDQIVYGISQTDGKISTERKAVGELIISGYAKPTSISAGVSASDSINTAIGKLDYNLEKEISRAEKEESDLSAKIDKAIVDLDTNTTAIGELTTIVQTLINEVDSLKQQITDLTSPKLEE